MDKANPIQIVDKAVDISLPLGKARIYLFSQVWVNGRLGSQALVGQPVVGNRKINKN